MEEHERSVSIGNRTLTNLRFADNINGLAGKEELTCLVKLLDTASTLYRMQISTEKIKLMTNNISTDIKVNNEKFETVHSFKYLGAIMSDEGSKPEVLKRMAQTTTALNKLNTIWNDKIITLS